MIGPGNKYEIRVVGVFGPSNGKRKAPLVVTARVELEKLLVQQLEDLPQLRKHIGK